jgi:flagellar biosynthetic protein FliQ
MSGDLVIQLAQQALMIVLIVSAPMLGLGLIVGLMVSVFQATTSIQEQTLAFIPKIIAVFVAILIFGPWMLRIMVEFVTNIFTNLLRFVVLKKTSKTFLNLTRRVRVSLNHFSH